MHNPSVLFIETLAKAEWRDNDVVMLHACFQLLCDVVENERLLTGNTDWEADEKQSAAKKEIEELYNWWLTRRTEDTELKREQYEIDNEMLIRLIKVRWALWT